VVTFPPLRPGRFGREFLSLVGDCEELPEVAS
jgi:hypothetical protein